MTPQLSRDKKNHPDLQFFPEAEFGIKNFVSNLFQIGNQTKVIGWHTQEDQKQKS